MSDDEWDVDVAETEVKKLSLGDDEDTAVADARAAADAAPGDAGKLVALARAQLTSGDDEGAVESLLRAAKAGDSADVQYWLGRAYAGDSAEKSRGAFKAAVALDGAHSGALFELGKLELDADQKTNGDAALDLFKRAAAADEGNLDAARQAGQLLLARGNGKDAADYLARVAKADPSDGNARAGLIQALDQTGNDADRDAQRKSLKDDAAAGKLNDAFVAFNRFTVGQIDAGDKLIVAIEHLKGAPAFTFNVYKKGEVHDSKILKTLTYDEGDYKDLKAKAAGSV